MKEVQLEAKLHDRVTTLSGGERRRLGLAEALTGRCDAVLLDEPTAGLDPQQRSVFLDVLGGLSVDVLMSTHQITDVAAQFEDVHVLRRGRVLWSGTVAELRDLGDGDAEAGYLRLMQGQQ